MLIPISARTLSVPCMVLAMVKSPVLALIHPAHEQDPAGKADRLHRDLHGGEPAHEIRVAQTTRELWPRAWLPAECACFHRLCRG